MPKNEKEFEEFISEFKKWQQKFGLNGYSVYFEHKALEDSFALLHADITQMVATAILSSKNDPRKNIKKAAKHESIHLLIARAMQRGFDRFVSSDQLIEAEEELVRKLEGLIPND